jgi:hypothetical protein
MPVLDRLPVSFPGRSSDYSPFGRYVHAALMLIHAEPDCELSPAEREIVKQALDKVLIERLRSRLEGP